MGASQMSQAAADRQADIDQKKAAWQQRTQAAAPGAKPGDTQGHAQQSGDHVGPSQQSGDGDAESKVPEVGATADGLSASADDASSSSNGEEEDGEVDAADNGQVCHSSGCWMMCIVILPTMLSAVHSCETFWHTNLPVDCIAGSCGTHAA